LDAEIFVSPKYGHEQSHMVPHDHYSRPYGVFFDDPRTRSWTSSELRWS
jgi:hypothetical protein